MLLTSALFWCVWPWLRPRLWPAAGASWLVVLDGHHRLDAAIDRQARSAEPILLITCPATGQPSASQRDAARGPLQVLRGGFDTAAKLLCLHTGCNSSRQVGGHGGCCSSAIAIISRGLPGRFSWLLVQAAPSFSPSPWMPLPPACPIIPGPGSSSALPGVMPCACSSGVQWAAPALAWRLSWLHASGKPAGFDQPCPTAVVGISA